MSLMVTPSCLPVSLTSASASGAVANRRPAVTLWLMKQSGGAKFLARSGCAPRSLDRRRTRDTPVAVSFTSRGSLRTSPTWSRAAAFSSAGLVRAMSGSSNVPTTPVGPSVRHRHGHLVGRCHTVGQHVVDLVDDRDAVVGQALGDVHLPERAIAVKRGAGDLADQLVQFAAAAGRGHPGLADVIVEVDVVVEHPHRVMQLHRDVDELVAKRRHRLQPRERHGAEQVEVVAADIGHIQHADLERVHVDFRCLGVQHQRVHTVESLHAHPIRRRAPTRSTRHCTPSVAAASDFGESSTRGVTVGPAFVKL